MAIKFLFDCFSLKLLIFRLVITYFGRPQIAPDHTIFVKKKSREQAPGPPSNSVTSSKLHIVVWPMLFFFDLC